VGWATKGFWFNTWQGQEIFIFKTPGQALVPTQPPIWGVLWALVFEVKELGSVAGYSFNLVPVLPYPH